MASLIPDHAKSRSLRTRVHLDEKQVELCVYKGSKRAELEVHMSKRYHYRIAPSLLDVA